MKLNSHQIQFGLIALQWFSLIVHPSCGFPTWPAFFLLPQNFFICVLFYDFYRKAYSTDKKFKVGDKNVKLTNGVHKTTEKFHLDYGKTID
jgi:hypothetical protein